MRAAGPEVNKAAAGWTDEPASVSGLPQGERRQEHALTLSRRRLAAVVFWADAALFLGPAAISSLTLFGVIN